ncbi:BCCT family transporter [Corynebacterium glyciniphilum]|uniref:BCCT family transporter n=1 Tax=Corynebacterium glyciniphilum TaxID=1404244 RepID=UPI002651CF4C|nr:BCCT family transporter [Corynebacterium glyciniphilum]MDN5684608.1 BCCT family transporter [Corynebacterium glyciniphilum]MDN6705512.1 BCCT family transporter [Corynebacterium glyciniphilum]
MLPPPAEYEGAKVDKAVVGFAALISLAVVVWGLASPDSFGAFADAALDFVVTDFGWVYIIAGTAFVFFILWVALSKYGRIRLGQDNERPEFNAASWIAMMFAAGMGIGLMFFGVAEPLNFYRGGVPGEATESVPVSMGTTLFHWALHPWAIYAIVALAIAYGTFRLGRKQLMSSAFIPLIGVRRAEGWLGKAIDILSIFATIFGTAVSLGLGALQIASGLNATDIVEDPGTGWLLLIIGVLGVCYLISAFSGVSKGIQYVSNFNMVMAAILAFFVLIVGPTVVIANMVPTAFGNYLQEFFGMAARTADSAPGMDEWLSANTLFYWAWWISWSPFVGTFIARISRGRTIREFILVVMLVPTAVSVVWFSIFGGSAIHEEGEGADIYGDGTSENMLFNLLHELPLGTVTSLIAMILLSTFFITSADSASTVMGTMSQNGKLVADRKLTVLWGLLTALIAVVLLVAGGDDALNSLQSIAIIAAAPFVILIVFLCWAIFRGLSQDPMFLDEKQKRAFALRLARERRHQETKEQRAAREARASRGRRRDRQTSGAGEQ